MTTPTSEPTSFVVGDTLRFKLSLSDYKASDGWSVKYSLRANGLAEIEFTSSADGDDHLINVPPATTATWLAGIYQFQAYVTNGSDRFTVRTGNITLQSNHDSTSSDPRSHARIMLDSIETVLESGAFREESSITFPDGRSIQYSSKEELLKMRNYYLAEVRQEEQAADVANGKGNKRRILVRFGRAS